MKISNTKLAVIITCLTLVLTACGGGGGGGGAGGNSTAAGDGGTPSTNSASSPSSAAAQVTVTNRVMLYVVPMATTSTEYFPTYDLTLTSKTQYLLRIFPDTGEVQQLKTYTSDSSLPSAMYPYSVDDRVFVRIERDPFEISGSHSFVEYSPYTNKTIDSFSVDLPYYYADGCSAIVGNRYYFKSHRNMDTYTGLTTGNPYVGGEFYSQSILTGAQQQLMTYSDTENCRGNLISDNNHLYDVSVNDPTTRATVTLFERDLGTGKLTKQLVTLNLDGNSSDYSNYHFAVSGSILYTARRNITTGRIEIYATPFNQLLSSSAGTTYVLNQVIADFVPYRLDVDDGNLMLASSDGQVYLKNLRDNGEQLLNLGMSIAEIQQLYIAQ